MFNERGGSRGGVAAGLGKRKMKMIWPWVPFSWGCSATGTRGTLSLHLLKNDGTCSYVDGTVGIRPIRMIVYIDIYIYIYMLFNFGTDSMRL